MNYEKSPSSKPRVPRSIRGRRAQSTAELRRRFFLAYISCGLTPSEARAFQRNNLAAARAEAAAARRAVRS